ncbi:hypothetical protein EWM64_g2762 [Hericium alpestre]|uniref:Uncharacterized protein n=1 Tax=Hericium alpestre TaxID=135208 RepID=A0A4Z0A4A0_9AGAM|nr:hypothetical protein EWM64_g2762 [Hericium alpestre]
MQHPSTPGPSRRRSPASLEPATFGPGAEQSRASQHDYAHTFMMTATPNAYYPYTTQAGYANDTNVQPYQQTGASYGAPAEWPKPSYHGPSGQSSTNYSPSSADQYAATIASTSTRQSAASGSHASSEKRSKAPKPIASTSRRPKDSKPDMSSKMGRWRLGSNAPAQAPSQFFAVGELKRKDRAPSPTEMTSAAEAPTNKKAKPAATGVGTSEGVQKSDRAEKAKKHRDKLSRDVADLATRLPQHLQLFEDKPTVANIRQAIIHIDELENEAAQLRAAHFQAARQSIAFQDQIRELQSERLTHAQDLTRLKKRIDELDLELQAWRQYRQV